MLKSKQASNSSVHDFYEKSYCNQGFAAQRRYPNEELCRFIGRNFHALSPAQKKELKVLETGCGSGANLWMLARENFDTYGLDISIHSIALAQQMLHSYDCRAQLKACDMSAIDYPDGMFNIVVDVFSSYCLNRKLGLLYLQEIFRVLGDGGMFFSYFPSKDSDAFIRHEPAELIDADTLSGIYRVDSPFVGNHYPFRFLYQQEYESILEQVGFTVSYSESVTKTYGRGKEKFSFLVMEAVKPDRSLSVNSQKNMI